MNLSSSHLRPQNLSEAEFKDDGLVYSSEERYIRKREVFSRKFKIQNLICPAAQCAGEWWHGTCGRGQAMTVPTLDPCC